VTDTIFSLPPRTLRFAELAELVSSVRVLILGERHNHLGCSMVQRFLANRLDPGWVLVQEGLDERFEASSWDLAHPPPLFEDAFQLARGTGVVRVVGCEPADGSRTHRDATFARVLLRLAERGERVVMSTGLLHAEPGSPMQVALGDLERVSVLLQPDEHREACVRVNSLECGVVQVMGRLHEAEELRDVREELLDNHPRFAYLRLVLAGVGGPRAKVR